MPNILILMTGGTICSAPADGKNASNAEKTGSYLEEDFRASDSPYRDAVEFDYRRLKQDILSENMTIHSWNAILEQFRAVDWDAYAGVIVLHGTDTLAYTAAMLALALAGAPRAVCMVSAQLRLKNEIGGVMVKEPRTNGYANFRAAVELIMNGIAPNVYAVYRNVRDADHTPGELLVHLGAHLMQCPNHSNNFHSADEMVIPDPANASLPGVAFETGTRYFEQAAFARGVLCVQPYTSLDYETISLSGIRAVVHGTYHSESVCIGRPKDGEDMAADPILTLSRIREEDRPYSMLTLLARAREAGIPVYLAPCDPDAYAYGSTRDALSAGAKAIPATTFEAAYAKVMLGCALGLRGAALDAFLRKSVNGEFVYAHKK